MACVLKVKAGLQNGAYTMLRRGVFPIKQSEINDIIGRGVAKKVITQAQADTWNALSLKEKKAFVLTDEFSVYKEAFTNESISGQTDVADSESRKRLEQKTVDAKPPSNPEKAIGPKLKSVASRPNVDLRPGTPDIPLQAVNLTVNEGVLSAGKSEQINRFLENLRDDLRSRNISFTEIEGHLFDSYDYRNALGFNITVKDGDKVLASATRAITPGKEIVHSLFTIDDSLQGKGIARDFLRVSLNLADFFDIPKISLHAALQNGAYSWLRYGFFPTRVNELDRIFVRARREVEISATQLRKWQSLTTREKKAFVLTDEFRAYKPALLNKEWMGSINIRNRASRAVLEGRITEARAPVIPSSAIGPDLASVEARTVASPLPDVDLRPSAPLPDVDSVKQVLRVNTDILSSAQTKRLDSILENLRDNLRRRSIEFTGIEGSLFSSDGEGFRFNIDVSSKDGTLASATRTITPGKELRLNLLTINDTQQGKGVSEDFLRLSLDLADEFKIPKITLNSSFHNDTFTWLRSGAYPEDDGLDALIKRGLDRGFLTKKQANFWDGLSSKEKRAFVLTDNFGTYKPALFNQSLLSSVDITNSESRALFERRVTEARAPSNPEKAIGPDLDSVKERPDIDLRPGTNADAKLQPVNLNIVVDSDILTPELAQKLNLQLEDLRSDLRAKGVKFTSIDVSTYPVGLTEQKLSVHIQVINNTDTIISARRVVEPGRELSHALFYINEELQGKGIARGFQRLTLGLADTFKIPKITLTASLQNGAYSWLRYGYFPTDVKELDRIFKRGDTDGKITSSQLKKWESLSKKEKKAFVLTDEFRNYKKALLGQEWSGSLDLTDPQARAIFEGRITEAPAPTNAKAAIGPDLDSIKSRKDAPPLPKKRPELDIAISDRRKLLSPENIEKLNLDLEDLQNKLIAKNVDFTDIKVEVLARRVDGEHKFKLNIYVEKDGERIITAERRFTRNGVMRHDLFTIDDRLQGRGISKDFLRLSLNLADTFKIKKIRVTAGLSRGAYVWLRYGFFPRVGILSEIFARAVGDGTLTAEQFRTWNNLYATDGYEKFVLSDEFRGFKEALKDREWKGEIDLTNPESRAIFEAKINEAKPPSIPEKTVGPDLESVEARVAVSPERAGVFDIPETVVSPTPDSPDVNLLSRSGDTPSQRVNLRIEEDTLTPTQIAKLNSHVEDLRSRLVARGIEFTDINATSTLFNEDTGRFTFEIDVRNRRDSIINAQRIIYPGGTLDHDLFKVSQALQGKGIARDFLNFSLDLADTFVLSRITLTAALENGAYSWLRYGFFADYIGDLDEIISDGERDRKITKKQEERWNSLSQREKKAFVLTDEFRGYKRAFLGKSWRGDINLNDPESRAILVSRITEAPSPPDPEKAIGPALESVKDRPDVDLRPGVDKPKSIIEFKLQEGVVSPEIQRRLTSDVEVLERNLRARGIQFSKFQVALGRTQSGGLYYEIGIRDADNKRIITAQRSIDLRSKILHHDIFRILDVSLQNKGLSREFQKISLSLADVFGLSRIELEAGITNGAYTWLRYGFFPTEVEQLDDIIIRGVLIDKLTEAHRDNWLGLSLEEKKTFVLSDDFKEFKQALLATDWDGGLDLDDQRALAAFTSRINTATAPVTDYTVDFGFADSQDLDADFINKWKRSVYSFSASANSRRASFDKVTTSFIEEKPGIWRATISLTDNDGATRVVDIDMTINQNDGSLRYNRFEINSNKNFGRIITDDALKVGRSMVETFGLKTISFRAGGETGAYSWLRHGLFPESFLEIDKLVSASGEKLLTGRQVNSWFGLRNDSQKRAFVLSEEFTLFRSVLADASWDGTANVERKVISDALFSDITPAPKTATGRAELKETTIEVAEDNVAESRIDKQVAKNKRNQGDGRRPKRTAPAFAQVADRYIAYAVDLNGVSENTVAKALEVYGRIELELAEAIRNESPGDATRATVRAKRQQVLLRQAQVILTNGVETIRNFTLADLSRLAIVEKAFNVSSINAIIGVEVASSSLTPIELSAIISDTLIQGAPSKEWWSRQTTRTVDAFSDAVRVGLLQGETTEQIVARIQGSFTGRRVPYRTRAGALRFKSEYTGGVLQTARRHTRTLVRTSVQTVSQAVRERVLDDNPDVVNGVQFLSTLDARTTPICQLHSGLRWDRERNPIGHGEPYPGSPPLHHDCRSTLLPTLVPWSELAGSSKKKIAEKIDKKERLKKRTQASANGQVPADLNYEGWLKTQSLSKQQSILGPKRYNLWKDGQINISAPRDL